MRHRSRGGQFSLLLVVALLLAACGGGGETQTGAGSGEPIRIGVLTSLTGNFTPWGVQVRAGMQLAVNEINQAGGAGGRQLELVVADDQSKAEEGARAIERLIARERLNPQMIVATGHPPGSGAITVQSADLGFDVPITGAYTPRSLVVKGAK